MMLWQGRRNPYVILGIPFGASRDQASDAFAIRARGLRHAPDGSDRLSELTWALNQVDEILKEPRLALEVYRVPADAESFEPKGSGLLKPPPEPMPRSTPSSAPAIAAVLDEAKSEFISHLRREVAENMRIPQR